MRNLSLYISSAMLGAVAFVVNAKQVQAGSDKVVKCENIAKAGKNDCGGTHNSCKGHAKEDGGFLMIPEEICEKIRGSKVKK